MTFKKRWMLFWAFFLCHGCGLKVGEVYEAPLMSTGLECMNHIDQQWSQYLEQTLPKKEFQSFSQCLQVAFLSFKYHVNGKQQNIYTPKELQTFMHRFFLKDTKISDSLMNNLMIFKKAIVGGNITQLTSTEIDDIIKIIEIVAQILSHIYPYNKTLFFNQKEATSQELKEAVGVLENSLIELSKIFKQPYSLLDANRLASNIQKLIQPDSDKRVIFSQLATDISPIILSKKDKTHTYAKQNLIVHPHEWKFLIQRMIDIFSAYIYFQKGKTSTTNYLISQTQYFSEAIEYVIKFFSQIISHTSNPIRGEDIENILQQLNQHKLLPNKITPLSYYRIFQILFGTIANKNPKSHSFVIQKKSMDWISSEYNRWKSIQNHLNAQYSYILKPTLTDATINSTINHLSSFPPFYNEEVNDDFTVYLSDFDQRNYKNGHKNLTMNAFYQVLIRAIFRGYAKQFPSKGLTKEEFITFLNDIKSILIDLNAVSPSVQFGNYQFLGPNLLTYSTKGLYKGIVGIDENGNQIEVIDSKEAIESLSTIQLMIQTFRSIHTNLIELCIDDQLTTSCFKRHILPSIQHSMNRHAPSLVSYLKSLTPEEKIKYTNLLYQIAIASLSSSTSTITNSQLSYVVNALIYQEIIFEKSNKNFNTLLEHDELMSTAFPYYEGMISYMALQLTGESNNEYTKEIYSYVVAHKKLPNFHSIWSRWIEIGLIENFRFWEVDAINRLDFMAITVDLVKALSKKSGHNEE